MTRIDIKHFRAIMRHKDIANELLKNGQTLVGSGQYLGFNNAKGQTFMSLHALSDGSSANLQIPGRGKDKSEAVSAKLIGLADTIVAEALTRDSQAVRAATDSLAIALEALDLKDQKNAPDRVVIPYQVEDFADLVSGLTGDGLKVSFYEIRSKFAIDAVARDGEENIFHAVPVLTGQRVNGDMVLVPANESMLAGELTKTMLALTSRVAQIMQNKSVNLEEIIEEVSKTRHDPTDRDVIDFIS